MGFTYKGGNDTTAKVPSMDPINVKGSNLRTREKSTM